MHEASRWAIEATDAGDALPERSSGLMGGPGPALELAEPSRNDADDRRVFVDAVGP